MTRYRAYNNEISPAVPCLFVYDATGIQTFDTSGEFHTWDTIKTLTSHFNYSADDDRVILLSNSSGLFILEFDCSFYTTANDADVFLTTVLYKNGSAQAGGTIVSTVSGNGSAAIIKTTQSLHYVIYLEKDDYIQIKTTASANSGKTSANSSRLMLNFLPMKGWDNDMAGRMDYVGGVMR